MEDKQVTDEEVLNGVEEIGDIDLASLDLNNLPSDPDELMKLVNGDQPITQEKEEEEEEETDEKPKDPEPSTEATEEEAPVLSADGKHQIPYSVLRRERDARRNMEAENAALQQQIEALKQQKPGEATQVTDVPIMDDAELNALAEEFPELAKVTAATRSENMRLRQELESTKNRVETMVSQWEKEQQAKQQAEVEKVNSEIDANPVLRYLRAEGDESLWKAAVEIDQRLQNSPAWADKPIGERFAKVVERLEEDFGPVRVPAAYQSPARKPAVQAAPRKPVEQDDDELTINTLSDLKGGSSPESTGINAENLTAADIGNIFLKMDPAQMAKMDPVEILRRL